MSAPETPPPEDRRPSFPNAEEKIAAKVALVRKTVLEKAGLDLTAEEVVKVHLLSMEPEYLARSIVFSITGNPIDLSGPEDDESDQEAAAGLPGQ